MCKAASEINKTKSFFRESSVSQLFAILEHQKNGVTFFEKNKFFEMIFIYQDFRVTFQIKIMWLYIRQSQKIVLLKI